jgi:hypothetical protein
MWLSIYQLISVVSWTFSAQEYNHVIVDIVERTAAVMFLKSSS